MTVNIFVLWFLWNIFGEALIIEGPKGGTYPKGSDIELQCIVEENGISIIWKDVTANTKIFIDKENYTKKEKYRNFQISPLEENYSLIIRDAETTDGGNYSCNQGDDIHVAVVVIEVRPNLTVCINEKCTGRKHSSENITAAVGDIIIVTCNAESVGANVTLELKVGENDWLEPKTLTKNYNGSYVNVVASHIHIISLRDTLILCRTVGHPTIQEVKVGLVISVYPPISPTTIAPVWNFPLWIGPLCLVLNCSALLLILWIRRRNEMRRESHHGDIQSSIQNVRNESKSASPRNLQSSEKVKVSSNKARIHQTNASDGDMFFESTMINDMGHTYAVPKKCCLQTSDGKHCDDITVTYAVVIKENRLK